MPTLHEINRMQKRKETDEEHELVCNLKTIKQQINLFKTETKYSNIRNK